MKTNLFGTKRFQLGLCGILVALLVVGLLLARKMNGILSTYICDMLTEQAATMARLENEYFESEYRQLTEMAMYLQSIAEEEDAVQKIASELFGAWEERGLKKGVLALDGRAIWGEALSMTEFPCIRTAFQGHNSVGYQPDVGLVFCVPVYRGPNVKYVVYYNYSPEETGRRFASAGYQGKAKVLVVDENQAVIVGSGDELVDSSMIKELENTGITRKLREKLNVATSAAEMGLWQGKKSIFFLAEVGDTGLLLYGQIFSGDVAGDVEALTFLVLWVFGLLMVLVFSGLVFIFSMEKKAMESEALREAKEAAERANAAKSEFLSNMSHEIRTPINAVLGMTEMILRESREPKILEYASAIDSSGNALLSTINDVLDISKIESGKMEILETQYDLYSLVNDCYHLVVDRARKKGLELQVSCQENLPAKLLGDMVHIRQIIVNFLTNSVKYTQEGRIDLLISGTVREEGLCEMKLEVRDTGMGMTKESMEKLFQKFQRFDMKRNQTVEGTGLGLAISRQLAELLGGSIEVSSEYGKGSSFCLKLLQKVVDPNPVGKISFGFRQEAMLEKQKEQHFEAPGKKLLVVDDVEMNLKVFGFLLKNSQMEIDQVLGGKQCLEKVCEKKYDIIFMDHMMPEMDGIETLQRMREMEGNLSAGAPVIMLTANATAGVKEEYIAQGFTDYLSKPVRGAQLEEMLRKYVK